MNSPTDNPASVFSQIKSGFVSLVGRPNAGKSTLFNQIVGSKVSIVSDKPQTTRHQIRGIFNRQDAQLVFVDTPGIHKPRTALGTSLNKTAKDTWRQVDAVCYVLDATAPYGKGDALIAERLPKKSVIVVTKTDIATPAQIAEQLNATSQLDAADWFPVSGRSGDGVGKLVDYLCERMPCGPRWYPEGDLFDYDDQFWVAELVREKLLGLVREELPHSIATRIVEWELPHIRCEILVERVSQRPMVVGKKGALLKQIGIAVRSEMADRNMANGMPFGDNIYLDLHVRVEKNWQRHPALVERFGY